MALSHHYEAIEMNRNDRVITDLTTGMELPQHKMLKALFDRSGLKRNDWHEKAQQLVGRSLGSPTKLSDIFNGKSRSLPMRDIVPYIQALGMRKSETDYYIAEFFKAYCDENLHQYVQSRSKSQQVLVLEQKVKVKNIQLRLLNEKLKNYIKKEKPKLIYQHNAYVKHKSKQHEEKMQCLLSQVERFKNVILGDPSHFEESRKQILAEDLENEFDRGLDLIEEEIGKYDECFFEDSLCNTDQDEYEAHLLSCAKELIDTYKQIFFLLVLSLRRADNLELIEFLSFCIPKDFAKKISKACIADKDSAPFEFRCTIEIMHAFLQKFRLGNKQGFDEAILLKIRFLECIESIRSKNSTETEIFYVQSDNEKYHEFFFDVKLSLIQGLPYLKNIPKELNEIIDLDLQLLEIAISEYADFYREGLQINHDLSQLYFLQNPHASVADLQDRKLIEKLINQIIKKVNEICHNFGAENTLEKIINDPDYPHMFDEGYK